jgi:hypothetical protein
MRKQIYVSALIMMSAVASLGQTTITPNIGLQNPAYGSTNWQVPWYYNTALLDSLLSGNSSLSNLLVTWNSAVTYPSGVIVTYNGTAYESLQTTNINHVPDTSATYWGKLSTTGNTNVSGAGTAGSWAVWTGTNILGSATVSVNDSSLFGLNFNDTTPAATSGYVLGKWQYSGNNISVEVPVGVTSLNSETGAVTLQSTGGTISITTPDSSHINLETGDYVAYNPSTTAYYLLSSSTLLDDSRAMSSAVTAGAWSCDGTTCTINTSSAHGYATNDYVDVSSLTSWFSVPSYHGTQDTGIGVFKITVTGTTQFTFPYTTNTGSGSGGSVYLANYWAAYQTANMPFIKGHGTFQSEFSVAANLDTNFSSLVNCASGTPTYLILEIGQNDILGGSSANTVESNFTSTYTKAHAAGCKIVQVPMLPTSLSLLDESDSYRQKVATVNVWLSKQAKSAANASSGAYWDRFLEPSPDMYTGSNFTCCTVNGAHAFATLINNSFAVQEGVPTGNHPIWQAYTNSSAAYDASNTLYFTDSNFIPRSWISSGDRRTVGVQTSTGTKHIAWGKDNAGNMTETYYDTSYSPANVASYQNGFALETVKVDSVTSTLLRQMHSGTDFQWCDTNDNSWFNSYLTGCNTGLSYSADGVLSFDATTPKDGMGSAKMYGLFGQATAPSGTCTSAQSGMWTLTQDGVITRCPSGGGTWTTFASGMTNPMSALGDTMYGGVGGAATRLAGNTTTTKQFLSQTGDGTNSAAPVWDTVGGVTSIAANSPITVDTSTGAVTVSCPTCGTSSGGSNVSINGGSTLANVNLNGTTPAAETGYTNAKFQVSGSSVSVETANPTAHTTAATLTCADTSGSGTAQSCNTSPSFTPVAGDSIIYTTTTANTGTGLTINVNSLGAKSVAKWQGTTTLAANDLLANKQVLLTYDGTNWEAATIGNAPSGGGSTKLLDNPIDAVPSSPSAMDDEFTNETSLDSKWTQVSTGSPTVSWVNGQTIYLTQPAHSSDQISYIYQSTPSTPWTVTIKLRAPNILEGYHYTGIAASDSTGELVTNTLLNSGNDVWNLASNWWTSPTVYSDGATCTSGSNNVTTNMSNFGWMYLRMVDDGTSLTTSYSMNGLNFITECVQTRTAFLTTAGPTRIGIYWGVNTVNSDTAANVSWFRKQ